MYLTGDLPRNFSVNAMEVSEPRTGFTIKFLFCEARRQGYFILCPRPYGMNMVTKQKMSAKRNFLAKKIIGCLYATHDFLYL